ncbi:Nucleic acid-binding OB-fold [Arabidopsis suecica]|uniref:Nucleic acid-binding OB-fold n=1 Tax=Arabidopsis suecica TaxID=45249 RepID=A0A8T1YPF8_ARASU|nr:Nucleic acid-binding OB-fold [Arabidopsis suecica]
MDFISELTMERTNWEMHVKLLSLWNKPSRGTLREMRMIVVDMKGNYIEVIVPNRSYKKPFLRNLSEGVWYYLQNFHVFPARSTSFLLSSYELRCMWDLTMVWVSEKTNNNFYHFVFPIEVEYAMPHQFHHVTDAVGVVASLSPIRRIPYVCRENETDYSACYVKLTIKDNMGNCTTCIALGECCETVVNKVSRILSSPAYNYQPIVAMLRFWRVQEFEGKNVVMSIDECARVYINPTFEDFHLKSFIRSFSDPEDDDVCMEEVASN